MASVNYMKFKSMQKAKAVIRHCDKYKRMEHGHTNVDIDYSKTNTNLQGKNSRYDIACKALDNRIAYLDEQPNANKRKDRVLAFGLDIPTPKDLDKTKHVEWARKVIGIVTEQYGADNIIGYYLHRDEVHEYTDMHTHEKTMSREHLHMIVVPEHDNKLNGKWFSNKGSMMKLNNSIHEMTKSDYGVDFMDGSKRKGPRVEIFKRESERLEIEQLKAEKADLESVKQATEQEILQRARQIIAERQTRQERYTEQAKEILPEGIKKRGKRAEKISPAELGV